MNARVVRLSLALVSTIAVAACTTSSTPTQPSSSAPSGSGSVSSLTASVTAPRPLQPADSATVRNVDQPLTLTVQNAVVTKSGTTTYTFEVATDSGFSAKVQTKDGVAEGSGGQTSVKIDTLTPNKDYYWHARAQGAGTTGTFSAASKFTVGPSLDAPSPVSPPNGATTSGWPVFRVNNVSHAGVVGGVVYRFEVATTAAFTNIIVSGTVNETAGQTSFSPPASQPAPVQTSLVWRATAIDAATGNSGPSSPVQSFIFSTPTRQGLIAAQEGVVMWPGTQPPGTNGHAVLGANWDVATVRSFDGITHVKPTLEELQVFDLLDRGFDPDGAIGWLNSNGYFTSAVWYPAPAVIGFPFEYLALIGGHWDVVIRAGG